MRRSTRTRRSPRPSARRAGSSSQTSSWSSHGATPSNSRGDIIETARALENDLGSGHIALSGSVSAVRQLLAAGLVDEVHLFLHPIAVGTGMRLFEDGVPTPR